MLRPKRCPMPDLARRLTRLEARLEACRIATPEPWRWVIAKTEAEAAAAEAACQPAETLVIWRVVDPALRGNDGRA
jgi:hypothetical protein